MIFTIEITEQSHLDGITKAREAYNASFAEDSSERINTDSEYVQFVMGKAAESYSKQYQVE
jgi:hypothetical protein